MGQKRIIHPRVPMCTRVVHEADGIQRIQVYATCTRQLDAARAELMSRGSSCLKPAVWLS